MFIIKYAKYTENSIDKGLKNQLLKLKYVKIK